MPCAVFKVGDKTVNKTHMAPASWKFQCSELRGEKIINWTSKCKQRIYWLKKLEECYFK